jgi:hypothetical protein
MVAVLPSSKSLFGRASLLLCSSRGAQSNVFFFEKSFLNKKQMASSKGL